MPLTNTERTKTLPHQDAARKDSERDGSRATPGEPSSPPRRAAPTPASQARHHPAAPPHLASQARHRDPQLPHPRAKLATAPRSSPTPGEPSSPPRPSSCPPPSSAATERTPQPAPYGSLLHQAGGELGSPGVPRPPSRGESSPQPAGHLYMQKKASDLSEALQGGDYLLSRFRSTIGVIRFNFSVRNGKRWSPYALITLIS